jgi:hypothetical protein
LRTIVFSEKNFPQYDPIILRSLLVKSPSFKIPSVSSTYILH